MKSAKKILAIILTVATLLAVIPFTSVSAGEYQLYYQHLRNIGFPEAYAEKLTSVNSPSIYLAKHRITAQI